MTDDTPPARENRTVRTAEMLTRLFPGRDLTATRPVALGDPGNQTPEQTDAHRRAGAMRYHLLHTPARFARAEADHPQVADWAAAYLRDMHSAPWLLLAGDTGTGKTHQAYGALRYLATSGWPAIAWTAVSGPDMYARLRPGGDNTEAAFADLAAAPLLLLDDLGAARDTPWVEETTYRLINRRYNDNTAMILTTNVAPREFSATFGARIASRLRERCIVIELRGPDRRTPPELPA